MLSKRPLQSVRRRVLKRVVPRWIWPKVVVVEGVSIPVRDAPYSFGIKRELSFTNNYELPERMSVRDVVRPGSHVIELGASIGVLTAVMAHLAGPSGRILAVEADSRLTRYASSWLPSKFPNTQLVSGFGFPIWHVPNGLVVESFDDDLGSLGGTVHFSLSRVSGSASMLESVHVDSRRPDVWDLARLTSVFGCSPNVLVADVEGSERVLAVNPPNYPESIRDVIMELHPWKYPDGSRESEAIEKAMLLEGFERVSKIGATYHWSR